MSRKRNRTRAEPKKQKGIALCTMDTYESLVCRGYTRLADNPEIATAIDRIAKLVGAMTIQLMENGEEGDTRIRNELSRKIDISPNKYTTRSQFVQWIVKTMLLEGNTVVYPKTSRGYLDDLIPVPANMVSFVPDGMWGYKVMINGEEHAPENVLHFAVNPDEYYPWKGQGYRVALRDVANNLKQAAATEKGFMESKWKPSLVVKVDALVEEFSDKEGRKKLLNDYLETTEAGEPWMIPAEQFEVEQIKPLTLADLALADFVQLDKRTVAAILNVPPFVVGVGEFKREEWNNFINTTIMTIAKTIEQELTKKLLYNPLWFFRFNARSLYNYDLKDLAQVADDQYIRGIMDGNEVRDWIGLPPREGLNKLVILENFIPQGMIGDQKKLQGGGEDG